MRYPVNEIFPTIQGEGAHAGTPALFIRLQGCSVGCPWCDTKHTWQLDEQERFDPSVVLGKTVSSPMWAWMTTEAIAEQAREAAQPLVVITGGEPTLLPYGITLQPLVDALLSVPLPPTVSVETSGQGVPPHGAWITLSPKIAMPGLAYPCDEAIGAADEIKMPVGKRRDIDELDRLLLHRARLSSEPVKVFVQPLSQNPSATKLCIEMLCGARSGWRLSIQQHKYIGAR